MKRIKQVIESISTYDYILNYLNIDDKDDLIRICNIGRALSAPVRLQILSMLNKQPKKLIDIARELNIQPSSAAFHLQILEETKLIKVENNSNNKGSHWFSYGEDPIIMIQTRELPKIRQQRSSYVINIPIGDFVDAKVDRECGMASNLVQIMGGEPNNIFSPLRHSAEIIWSSNSCYFEYVIPNDYATIDNVASISFSLELCSEARGYNSDFPSDITFSVNGLELCTFTSLGDYGDRYGAFTPEWWYIESTKYGVLVNLFINNKGVYLNEKLVTNKITLKALNLDKGNRTTFKIEVKPDAKNVGGLNLFGKNFGDFDQDIKFTAKYVTKETE